VSFGKMNAFIDIVNASDTKDAEGFAVSGDTIIASVRAYKENRHGSEKWTNMASFADANALFRFRIIPNVTIDTTRIILCGGVRYEIVSVEDVRGRGMYIEALCRIITPSKG